MACLAAVVSLVCFDVFVEKAECQRCRRGAGRGCWCQGPGMDDSILEVLGGIEFAVNIGEWG